MKGMRSKRYSHHESTSKAGKRHLYKDFHLESRSGHGFRPKKSIERARKIMQQGKCGTRKCCNCWPEQAGVMFVIFSPLVSRPLAENSSHRVNASSPVGHQVGSRHSACSNFIHAVGLERERVREKNGPLLPYFSPPTWSSCGGNAPSPQED